MCCPGIPIRLGQQQLCLKLLICRASLLNVSIISTGWPVSVESNRCFIFRLVTIGTAFVMGKA